MVVSFLQFVGLLLDENFLNSQVSGYVYSASRTIQYSLASVLTAIPILLFATVGLFLVLYMHPSWGTMSTVMAHSQVARHILWSTMLASWILFLWMIVTFYIVSREMAVAVQNEKPLRLFRDNYTPQVTAGYVRFGSFLAILLLEAPFLFVFFFRKSTKLHNRQQQLSKTHCHLCYWITVLCDTFGGMSVVAAAQNSAVYLFYIALNLMVSTIFTIAWVTNGAAYILVGIVCIAILFQMVSSCCKTCSFERIIRGLAFLLLGLLCFAINYYVVEELREDKQGSHNSIRGLLTSLVSSVIIAIYGYIVKKLLYRKKKDVGEEERAILESAPLIQKAEKVP